MLIEITIILATILVVIGMAKHGKGRGRRFRKYLKGQIDVDQLLGTLAAETLFSAAVPDTVVEKAWCSSVRAAYSMLNYTPGPTIGPITFGVAHSDYTSAEIEEWIESLGSWDAGDLRSQEIARRKIRMIGTFENPSSVSDTARFNDGRQITTKCGWMLQTGQTVRFWWYNEGSGALATTDPTCHVSGHANLWPA